MCINFAMGLVSIYPSPLYVADSCFYDVNSAVDQTNQRATSVNDQMEKLRNPVTNGTSLNWLTQGYEIIQTAVKLAFDTVTGGAILDVIDNVMFCHDSKPEVWTWFTYGVRTIVGMLIVWKFIYLVTGKGDTLTS